MIEVIEKEINKKANEKQALQLSKYFKTGKGEYAEGDIFLGLKVPEIRELVKKYHKDTKFSNLEHFIQSQFHEYRLFALFCLVEKMKKADAQTQKDIYEFYKKHTNYINNWDLVDLSAPKIPGIYCANQQELLMEFANSNNMWSKRIAIVSTAPFIKQGDFKMTLKLAKKFLSHPHDLMHKATGWMLREIGKKDMQTLYKFLDENYSNIPRTTLRYAIERMDEPTRQSYLKRSSKAKI